MLSKKHLLLLAGFFLVSTVVLTIAGVTGYWLWNKYGPNRPEPYTQTEKSLQEIKRFKNQEEFSSYISQNQYDNYSYWGGVGMSRNMIDVDFALEEKESGSPTSPSVDGSTNRVSDTNVQVLGIDEADYVKTDGKTLYISSQYSYYPVRCWDCDYDYPSNSERTTIMDIQNPAQLKMLAEIESSGELYLVNDMLLILSYEKIVGYDISDKENPKESWKYETKDKTSIVTTRKYNNQIYVVTNTSIQNNNPCPIIIMEGKEDVNMSCNSIYYPTIGVPVDSTYTIIVLNPENGKVKDQNSFVGLSDISTVYMSYDNIYVTYYYPGDMSNIMIDFFAEQEELFTKTVTDKIKKLRDYDISQESKMTEIGIILEQYYNSLTTDEQRRLENEIENKMSEYMDSKKRELSYTGIMKIAVNDLEVKNVGVVPGTLLNQFSLDEYEGNLRVATTIEPNWWFGMSNSQSVSDIYVFDSKMNRIGKVLDLGKTERIYAVRFVGKIGYVVTFRQTDPFYVIDLSNPNDPQMRGELKIPGYSAYLHPLDDNYILGVGREDSKVKLSIFNVSDPSNPKEESKYILDDYYTEIEQNHHGFLLDKDHEYFFIPGSNGGYIFSYDDMELSLDKVFDGYSIDRAVYVNETLFVINTVEADVKAYEIGNWEEIKN